MKIQKKVPVMAGFTDKSRDINAEKAKIKWENRGWTIVNRIDGGLTETSYLELEKEEAEKQGTIKKTKNKKLTLKNIGIAYAVLVVINMMTATDDSKKVGISAVDTNTQKENKQVEKIDFSVIKQKANNGDKEAQFELGVAYYTGKDVELSKNKAFEWFEKSANQGYVVAQRNLGVMYDNGEGVNANHKKAVKAFKKAIKLGSKDAQSLLYKINLAYSDKQSVIINVLSGIWTDISREEKRFNNFLKVVGSNDIVEAIRGAQNNKDKITGLTYKSYASSVGKTYKEIDDKETVKAIEDLVKYSQNTNLYLQLYYSSFLEYVDNQKPSLLVKVKDNMNVYESGKFLIITKSFEIGEKYDLDYDTYSEHWRTKENVEADKVKRNKEQEEAKKKKPFIDLSKYKEKSAQYVLAKFITAWQYRDFKDMVKYTQTSWSGIQSPPYVNLTNNFNSRYLTSAKLEKSKCDKSLCNISVSITYKNSFNDKIETYTIKPNVIEENGKWGVNPMSALQEY
jgi:hypothetical protein